MAQVKFWRGTFDQYKDLNKDEDTIYFVTDCYDIEESIQEDNSEKDTDGYNNDIERT